MVYQLCVAPGNQRKQVGAALVKAVFERSAYGCKLYCCWCAQDIEANHFWESIGFVPIAFRAGSTGKRRVHIFWQRRINAADDVTPYWYPFQTNSGAIREDRIVFPIPPGVHWTEVRAVNVPTLAPPPGRALPARKAAKPSDVAPKRRPAAAPPGKVGIIVGGRVRYVDRPGATLAVAVAEAEQTTSAKPARQKAERPPKPKYDPKYLAAARELRDRALEHVNRGGEFAGSGKYDVSRTLGAAEGTRLPNGNGRPIPLLAAG